jgi:RNA polymerase sigma factor (sigma-70 family)
MLERGFREFLEILRSGDAEAVDQLLGEFDPFMRRAIRLRLFDRRARRVVDTADILQSLLKDFLERERTDASGAAVEKLEAYLAAAARYKVASKVRKEKRRAANLSDIAEPASREPSSCQQVEDREQIETLRSRLDDRHRRLLDLSAQGMTWRQIADEIGGHPDTLRIDLRRSIAAALAPMRDQN